MTALAHSNLSIETPNGQKSSEWFRHDRRSHLLAAHADKVVVFVELFLFREEGMFRSDRPAADSSFFGIRIALQAPFSFELRTRQP